MNLYIGDTIVYTPKNKEYVIKDNVKVKQDDGTWKSGVSYHTVESPDEVYVRALDQLEKFQIKSD